MALTSPGPLLQLQERDDPLPRSEEIRVKVSACGVCRTDLHVVDAELPGIKYPIVPGHEIVGRVDLIGANVINHRIGDRVGIPWLGYTCGVCRFCKEGMENLCDRPLFTGYTRDGGFATHTIADARYAFPLGELGDDVAIAPLMCAGLIGWRSLVMAGNAERLGIYGFGAAGHIVAQVARWQGRSVYAFTRSDDVAAQDFARRLGAVWAGASDQLPDAPLDAAIIYAPAGQLVPTALRAVRKGGRVICAGIHMSDIPSLHHKANTIGSGHAAPDLKFLAQVTDAVRDAGQILIIGPSTAKTELAKYFRDQDSKIGGRIVAVEAADHPSDGEIIAHARQYFGMGPARAGAITG